MTSQSSGNETIDVGTFVPDIPLGPYRPPYITCGKCGKEHHYDAAIGEYLGRCFECSAFLRRPTQAEHEQFNNFLAWNSSHAEREYNQEKAI